MKFGTGMDPASGGPVGPASAVAEPLEPAAHRAAAETCRANGDELGALAHLVAAETLEQIAAGTQPRSAMPICDLGTGYFMKGEYETAERWYRLSLALDPGLAIAYQNLAAICAYTGRAAEAASFRERAYQVQRIFIEQAGSPLRRVLVLCAGRTAGNVPFETLLPAPANCRIKYVVDYAAEQEDAELPPYDLVFNAIGESDVAAGMAERMERFAAKCGRPLLNPPSAVERTRRDAMAALLDGLDDVVVAPCVRCERPPATRDELASLIGAAGIGFPVLARPAATHGGEGLTRCKSIDELEIWLCACAGSCYLSEYCDYRSTDGLYRKYRTIFVDRQPLPYHLAVSPRWMVHYYSAEMESAPWKIGEEHGFLRDPGAVLGARASAALAAIGQRIDLDFAGVDYALLADGRVFVFEANATMLVHRERMNGPLAHKNAYVQDIVDAFERMLSRHSPGAGRA